MRPIRVLSAGLLAGCLAVVAAGQAPAPKAPPTGTVAQNPPKDGAPKDDMAKGKDKEKEKEKPFEWPKEIGGKDPAAYVKELTDPDPHIRNIAFQTLPKFGPEARKIASKPLVKALDHEWRTRAPGGGDSTVIASAINAIADLRVEDSEVKEASRLLGLLIATQGPYQSLYRQYAIPALASFGHKAENAVTVLSEANVLGDPSYEIRRLTANALFLVGQDEHRGPTPRALEVLCKTSINDVSAAVRVEAYQTLVLFGPPVLKPPPGKPLAAGEKPPAPQIDKALAARWITPMKNQLKNEKDQQVEAWARLAIMRFDPEKELNEKNLKDLAQIIVKGNSMAKFHALNAIALLGERAEKQLTTIVEALQNKDPIVLDAAVKAMVSMAYSSKRFLPELKARLEAREEEYFHELLKVATKIIEEAKPPGTTETPSDSKPDPKDPKPDPKKPPMPPMKK